MNLLRLRIYPVDATESEVTEADCFDSVASITSTATLAGVSSVNAAWPPVIPLSSILAPGDATLGSTLAPGNTTLGSTPAPGDNNSGSILAPGEVNSGFAITSVLLLLVVFDGSKSSDDTSAIIPLLGSVIFCDMIYSTPYQMSSHLYKIIHTGLYPRWATFSVIINGASSTRHSGSAAISMSI